MAGGCGKEGRSVAKLRGMASQELYDFFLEEDGHIHRDVCTYKLKKYTFSPSRYRMVLREDEMKKKEGTEGWGEKVFSVVDSFTNDSGLLASRTG